MAISGINGGNAWEGYQILFFSILGAVFLSFIGVRISWYARISAEKRGELGEQVGQSREGESEGVTRVQEAEAMVAAEEAEK